MGILTWLRRRKQPELGLRSSIVRAIGERRYDEAEAFCRRLPASSAHRQIYWLQLLIARSKYEEAAQFYEHADAKLRSQRSARGRYLRALSALGRTDDVNRVIQDAFDVREDSLFLAALFPYMRPVAPDLRSKIAEYVLAAQIDVSVEIRIACAQMLLDTGQVQRVAEILAAISPATPFERAETALLRSNLAIKSRDDEMALKYLSEAFDAFGMEAVLKREPEEPLTAENLTSRPKAQSQNLPKATVIVSCFNSEKSIGSALDSLRAQSHRNIEIVVIDDCSTDGSLAVIERIAAQDPRIRIIRSLENRGTYYARNMALAGASGDFVLAHDADDWAPPQKVERLVRYLMERPDLIAVRGRMIRFAKGVGAHFRHSYIRPDFSSLTFRRESALAKAGYFDCVRAGADSEYAFRLQRIFGEGSVGDLKELVTVMSSSPESLTGGGRFSIDMDTGVFSPPRAAYQQAYFAWHEHATSFFVGWPDQTERPFHISPETKA